jgi:hypothetical protein
LNTKVMLLPFTWIGWLNTKVMLLIQEKNERWAVLL